MTLAEQTGGASPLHDALAVPAADARARFGGHSNGYLDGSDTVHAVRLQDWLGIPVPGPGCHVGTGTWDFTRFRPTRFAVTCGRCLKGGLDRAAPLVQNGPGQLLLDIDPKPQQEDL